MASMVNGKPSYRMKNRMGEIKVAILTVSDRSFLGEREDRSGPALSDFVKNLGWEVVITKIVSDDKDMIVEALTSLTNQTEIDLLLTTGGTGLSPRDNTPEATMQVVEKTIPGFSEFIRSVGSKTNRYAILSRGVSGILNHTLIINLPGSPVGAVESLISITEILPHAINQIKQNKLDFH